MLRIITTLGCFLVGAYSLAFTGTKEVVLLGDSYSSGNGARNSQGQMNYDSQSKLCYRSPTTWGAQVSNALGASYVNSACAGSVMSDISSQMLAITLQTDLVLLTIGGNDFGFGNIITKCFLSTNRVAADCQSAINFAVSYVPTLEANLTSTLLKLNPLLNATGSKVVLVAYPFITLDVPFVFNDSTGGGSVELTRQIRSLGLAVDAGQHRAVQAANTAAGRNFVFFFNQTKALFEGHEPHPSATITNSVTWIWELDQPITEVYHINPTGHAMLSRALLDVYFPNVTISTPVPPPVAAPVRTSVSSGIREFFRRLFRALFGRLT
jgi:lysophospholipase L1-like esterase